MNRDPRISIPADYRSMVERADVYMASDWLDMAARLTWLANWAEGDESKNARELAGDCHRRAREARVTAELGNAS